MRSQICNQLVLEIGSLILNNKKFATADWFGLSLVGRFGNSEKSMNGYVYFANSDFEARSPAPSFDVLDKVSELREEMAKEKGQYWHQCLIHITKPDMKINIQFEYDDPDRWSLKKVSLDMKDYADSLKPPC